MFIFASIGLAQSVSSQDKQNLACSSINNQPLSQGAKSILLKHCMANAAGASKFTSTARGDFVNLSDNTADLGNCGHPTQDFYFESGFQKYSDSNGGKFNGPYVYVAFTNYDCDGILVNQASCFTGVPDGAVELTPFETATVIADLDIECTDGSILHLTTNVTVTGEGFTNYDKNKHVTKRETFNETNDYTEKWRDTTAVGQVMWNGHSYDLGQDGRIGNYKSKFTHKDL
jgi:hypothetical protein